MGWRHFPPIEDSLEPAVTDDQEVDYDVEEEEEAGCEEVAAHHGATDDAGASAEIPDIASGEDDAAGGEPLDAGAGSDDDPDVEEDAGS